MSIEGPSYLRRLLVVAVICAFAATAVAGCGGSGDGGGSDEAAPTKATVGFSDKIITLDPDQAGGIPDVSALHLLGGNLYRLTPDGKAVPGLAESATASADELTWTFKLRPNLKFSDGSPLTADDVVATIERMRTDKANLFGSYMERVKSVKASSPTEVRIDVSAPYPSLPTVLAEPQSVILPAGDLEKPDFFSEPISAGPYKLKSWGESNTLVMVRNPHFAGPKPEIEQITFATVPDANDRLAQTQAGQIELGVDLPPNLLSQMAPAAPQVAKTFGFFAMSPNVKVSPTDEKGVREAINLAVDREQIVETVFDGNVDALAGFWPPTYPGYDPGISTEQDLDAARQALQGTKCENGCTMPLLYTESYAWSVQAATIVQRNLKEIGIDVKLESVDFTTYYNKLIEGKTPLSMTFAYDYADIPDGLLLLSFSPGSSQWSYFEAPGQAKLVEETDQSSGAELERNLARVNDMFVAETPFSTLTAGAYVNAARFPKALFMGASGVINVAPGL
ncbi:MAG TPA: ABC transporter substrate-binding protein [Solirubrobacterales bacterium]|nr:ABC transporter substrate-binding protein [Solirubrobacterales bacterium]